MLNGENLRSFVCICLLEGCITRCKNTFRLVFDVLLPVKDEE